MDAILKSIFESPLAFGVFVIGFGAGMVLTIVAWKHNTDGKENRGLKDPRVTVLAYGSIGLVAVLIADWDKFVPDAGILPSIFAVTYLFGFVSAAFIVLFFGFVFVWLIALSIQRRYTNCDAGIWLRWPLDFVFKGYAYCHESINNAKQQDGDSKCAKLEESIDNYRNLVSGGSKNLGGSIAAAHRYISGLDNINAAVTFENILKGICEFTNPWINAHPSSSTNANVMLAHKIGNSPHGVIPNFKWHDEISHILVIQHYANLNSTTATHRFALPVEPMANGEWKDRVLPGAPSAFLTRQPQVVRKGHVDFNEKIPNKTRKEINSYLDMQNFNCFFSFVIAMCDGDHPIGVVNIEASRDESESPINKEMLDELNLVLQPHFMLLGMLLYREKNQGNGP